MLSDKVLNRIRLSIQIILAVFLFLAGSAKFLNAAAWTKMFSNWGYPVFFSYVIGLLEMAAAIGLFIDKTRLYSVYLLTMIMLGALGTHLVHSEFHRLTGPLLYLVFLGGLYYIMQRSPAQTAID